MASAYNYDVIAVTETWAHTEINNAELAIEGFNMYRMDRKESRGGGVLLYINDTFTSSIIEKLNSEGCEDSVWCTVRMGSLRLLIAVCYRSPSSSKENNSMLLANLERAVNEGGHDRVLIMGDFNYREIDYTNYEVAADETSEAYKFFSKTLDLYLVQNVTQATRIRNGTQESLLDYIFTNEEMLVDDLQYQTPLGKSDHVCLVWNYIVSVEEQETQQRKFNYWKGDYNKINADLGSHDWEKIIGNDTVNDAWNKFKRILQETVDRNIPLLGIRKEKKSRNPWLTKATKRYISKRNKAWRKFNDLKTESNYSIYKKLRNEANKRVKIDQSVYRKKILRSFKGNHKKILWLYEEVENC